MSPLASTVATLAVSLTGLALSTLVPLGIGLGAVVSLLYVLRLRRRPVTVAFVRLFERHVQDEKASALRSRLRRLLSWLLHLLLAGLLVLALGEPVSDAARKQSRSVVVLIDVSASMGAPASGTSTRLETARREVEGWLEGLGEEDRMLLVEMGARPRPLSAWTNDRRQLEERLGELRVLDVGADLARGVRLAEDALVGRKNPSIVVVGDGAYPALDLSDVEVPIAFHSVSPSSSQSSHDQAERNSSATGGGSPTPDDGSASGSEAPPQNVGIVSLAARRYPLDPERYGVLLEVANTGSESASVEVTFRAAGADGAVVDVVRLDLPPGASVRRSLSELRQLESGVSAEVRRIDGGQDVLPADDRAWALLPPLVPRRILVVGPPNTFLDAALLLDPSLRVERIAASEYPPEGRFDAVIFDRVFPQRVARTGSALYLGAVPADAAAHPLKPSAELEMFGFDQWDDESELFRFLNPYDVQVLEGTALEPGQDDRVLGRSGRKPILVEGRRQAGRFVALGFDPRQSDFVLRVAWPLFLANSIRHLAPSELGEESLGLSTGRLWRVPAPGLERAEIVGPMHLADPPVAVVSAADGRAVLYGEQAGLYTVRPVGGGEPVWRFAASFFDEEEAQLSPRAELSLRPPSGSSKSAESSEEPAEKAPVAAQVSGFEPRLDLAPWVWLVLFVAAVSFLEWWTYHRRWTV